MTDGLLTHACIPTLTLAAGEASNVALDLLKVLACAGVVAVVLGRIRIAVIPGYLIAGALIGPHGIGLVGGGGGGGAGEGVSAISELALVLLMFGIGLHLDIAGMRRGAGPLLILGAVSTTLVALGCVPIGMALGLGAGEALGVGMALSMSSTAVVLRLVQQRRELHRIYGRLSFGTLLIQDLMVIGMLTVIPMLGTTEAAAELEAGAQDGGVLTVVAGASLRIGGVALMIVGGKLLLPRAMNYLAKHNPSEVMLVIAAAVALGAAVLSGALGLSPELGAFIAGFLLASTTFRYQISGQMTPLRDLFMAVFFTAVGLELNVIGEGGVLPLWWVVLIGIVSLVVLKVVFIGGLAWAVGAMPLAAAQTGLTLAQAGEFSLVVLAAAGGVSLVSEQTMSVATAVVVVSLVLTPGLMHLGRWLVETGPMGSRRWPIAPWVRASSLVDRPTVPDVVTVSEGGEGDEDNETADAGSAIADLARCPVIVAGYGPVGRSVADRLDDAGIPYTIIELNTKTVRTQMTLGRSIVFGDITNPEVLESAGVHEADAVVITIPDEDAMLRAVRQVRSASPTIFVAARANVLSKAMIARQLGADHVTVEEMATADTMAREVIVKLRARRGSEATGSGGSADGADDRSAG